MNSAHVTKIDPPAKSRMYKVPKRALCDAGSPLDPHSTGLDPDLIDINL